ncbi:MULTISPECIES: hypothetical protein [Sphingomonas]|uniref:hypothetical protein n=1 Tax=Sphingomonas TaxID=13687 RepID=UPI000DEF396C|nr:MULTISPECIES: hypothetical protein [Sphingomonas]
MDGAGPFIVSAMVVALVVGLVAAILRRWWVALLVGTLFGELAFLVFVPIYVWMFWAPGFLPFAIIPAGLGVTIGAFLRKRRR